MKRVLALFALFAGCCFASGTNVGGVPSVVPIPSSLTALITVASSQYVSVQYVTLHNITASAVTIKILDQSTNCNSAACPVVSSSGTATLSVAANSTVVFALGGQPAVGGIQWSASAANSVMAWISWY